MCLGVCGDPLGNSGEEQEEQRAQYKGPEKTVYIDGPKTHRGRLVTGLSKPPGAIGKGAIGEIGQVVLNILT